MGNVYTVPPDVGDIWSYVTRELTSPKNVTTDDNKIDNSKISNLDVLSSSRQKQFTSNLDRVYIDAGTEWNFPNDCFFMLTTISDSGTTWCRFYYTDTEYVTRSLTTLTLYIAKAGRVRLYNSGTTQVYVDLLRINVN